jgi:hypothetical protein
MTPGVDAVGDRHIREGDIVVTAVAHHYAIGRMTADSKTHKTLAVQPTVGEALAQACVLAGTTHRVFLYGRAGKNEYRRVNCAERSRSRRDA